MLGKKDGRLGNRVGRSVSLLMVAFLLDAGAYTPLKVGIMYEESVSAGGEACGALFR